MAGYGLNTDVSYTWPNSPRNGVRSRARGRCFTRHHSTLTEWGSGLPRGLRELFCPSSMVHRRHCTGMGPRDAGELAQKVCAAHSHCGHCWAHRFRRSGRLPIGFYTFFLFRCLYHKSRSTDLKCTRCCECTGLLSLGFFHHSVFTLANFARAFPDTVPELFCQILTKKTAEWLMETVLQQYLLKKHCWWYEVFN